MHSLLRILTSFVVYNVRRFGTKNTFNLNVVFFSKPLFSINIPRAIASFSISAELTQTNSPLKQLIIIINYFRCNLKSIMIQPRFFLSNISLFLQLNCIFIFYLFAIRKANGMGCKKLLTIIHIFIGNSFEKYNKIIGSQYF